MPVKVESTPMLLGLSPVGGNMIVTCFDAARTSSSGRLLALREVEQRLAVGSRLPACIHNPRDPSEMMRSLDEIVRTRMLMIATGYEDGNDADRLCCGPMFKVAMGRLQDDGELTFTADISGLENLQVGYGRSLVRLPSTQRRQGEF